MRRKTEGGLELSLEPQRKEGWVVKAVFEATISRSVRNPTNK